MTTARYQQIQAAIAAALAADQLAQQDQPFRNPLDTPTLNAYIESLPPEDLAEFDQLTDSAWKPV